MRDHLSLDHICCDSVTAPCFKMGYGILIISIPRQEQDAVVMEARVACGYHILIAVCTIRASSYFNLPLQMILRNVYPMSKGADACPLSCHTLPLTGHLFWEFLI